MAVVAEETAPVNVEEPVPVVAVEAAPVQIETQVEPQIAPEIEPQPEPVAEAPAPVIEVAASPVELEPEPVLSMEGASNFVDSNSENRGLDTQQFNAVAMSASESESHRDLRRPVWISSIATVVPAAALFGV